MTKVQLVNIIAILLDLEDSAKPALSKVDLNVLKKMYEKMLENAKYVGFQKELTDQANAKIRSLETQVRNLEKTVYKQTKKLKESSNQ